MLPMPLLAVASADPAALAGRIAMLDRKTAEMHARIATERAPLARLLAIARGTGADAAHAQALARALSPRVAARGASIETRLAAFAAERDVARVRLATALAADAAAARRRDEAATARLASLAIPAPPGPAAPGRPVYRLAVAGRVVSGTGERLETGVQARGLTLLAAPSARVVAPALGRIVYARVFRGYGGVVILDHGHGWTTLLAGLDRIGVNVGTSLPAGTAVGTLPAAEPRLTIELRHRGHPVDVASMAAMRTQAQFPPAA